ncbi:hypothetical protein VOLCADRAFT_117059 [Volvox carteri f. nagariensis]|uniref:Protein kinase domain-containing protein n=1 Tax=Volvox carteri f. nagariensis TaxID=3068 RepID=D8TS20_VOLCA|nr:uncharacterized protein VOLCADRAFT_117059 [Volvox carteri f. nagariensis]EFJ49616.1 hypothetical protein VOLCADRAFT_117059 [Volvox carteri f. nagariensis]|eukprot:XP_002949123.1 hypothetical protein VOLCADRAFT_117059 [Volvox carteri f. nagariensis]
MGGEDQNNFSTHDSGPMQDAPPLGSSTMREVQQLRPVQLSEQPHDLTPSITNDQVSSSSLESGPTVALIEECAVEYGVPGWERLLTAQIAACSGMSTSRSRRAAPYCNATVPGGGDGGASLPFSSTETRLPSSAQAIFPFGDATPTPPPSANADSNTQTFFVDNSTVPGSFSRPARTPCSMAAAAATTGSIPAMPPLSNLVKPPPSLPAAHCRSRRSSFRQVVLPKELVSKAAEQGTDLRLDLRRDVAVDCSRTLGWGQFGAVYPGTFRGEPVAIKSVRHLLRDGCTIDDLEVFVQEITVLSSLHHDNVVRLLGGCLQPPDICLVEELCVTSLDLVLHSGAKSPLPLFRILEIALNVALGLEYLHSRTPAVVHRDLKPANILLDKNGRAKISDFGLARCKYSAYLDTNRPETGSMAYMAPECWDPHLDGGLSDKMDIFSFGVVLWELVVGERPWAGCKMSEFVHKVVTQGARLEVPTDDNVCPYALRRLISSCTERHPSERPTIRHITNELPAKERCSGTRSVSYRVPSDDESDSEPEVTSAAHADTLSKPDAVEEQRQLLQQQLLASLEASAWLP